MKDFLRDRRPHAGMTYAAYLEYFKTEVARAKATPEEKAPDGPRRFLELNLQRTSRIGRTYSLSDALRLKVSQIERPQLWMVLTEAWCGDSAQNLPYIAKIAACSPQIDLRILLRDQNLDIMDQYLTDGTRGIPKLVAFDERGSELFAWGPRPREGAELFRHEKAAGTPKEKILEKLHLWYGRNRGQALEQEFLALLT